MVDKSKGRSKPYETEIVIMGFIAAQRSVFF